MVHARKTDAIQYYGFCVAGFHKRPVRPLQCLRQPSRDSNSGLKYLLGLRGSHKTFYRQ